MDWPIAAIAALLSPASAAGPSVASLDCVGTGQSSGYPSGVQQRGETRYRVEGRGPQTHVWTRGGKDQNICPPGATCTIEASEELVHVSVSRIPNADPLYSTSFHLDRGTLTFDAHGGGLDGGWSVNGTCAPSAH